MIVKDGRVWLINEGEKRGMELGTLQTLFRLVDSNNITVDVASKDIGVTKEEFLAKMKEVGIRYPAKINIYFWCKYGQ